MSTRAQIHLVDVKGDRTILWRPYDASPEMIAEMFAVLIKAFKVESAKRVVSHKEMADLLLKEYDGYVFQVPYEEYAVNSTECMNDDISFIAQIRIFDGYAHPILGDVGRVPMYIVSQDDEKIKMYEEMGLPFYIAEVE